METIEQKILTYGIVTELTKSQTENSSIVKKHWENFNKEIRKHNLTQNGGNWVKFGITYKIAERYMYLAAIPAKSDIHPSHFTFMEIPQGDYEVFSHKGKMENIKQTYYEIYKVILPKSDLIIENHLKTGFIHFEKYDYRFQWNAPSSIIDIYLPLNTIQQ